MNYACLGFNLQLVKFLKNQRECASLSLSWWLHFLSPHVHPVRAAAALTLLLVEGVPLLSEPAPVDGLRGG